MTTLGSRLVALRTAILEAIGREPAPVARPDFTPDGVSVGVCSSCGGDVAYSRARGEASCPCGLSKVPRAFLAWGVASAKPWPRP